MLRVSIRNLKKFISLEQENAVIVDAQSLRIVVDKVESESLVTGDTPGMGNLEDLIEEGIARVVVGIRVIPHLVVVRGTNRGIVEVRVGQSQNDRSNNAHLLVTHGNDIRARDEGILLSLEKVRTALVL